MDPIHNWATPKKLLPIHVWPTHIFAEIPRCDFGCGACVKKLTSQLPLVQLSSPRGLGHLRRHQPISAISAGSNNTNLLVPSGQFGTRLQGGKVPVTQRWWWSSGIDLGIQEENLKMGKDKYICIYMYTYIRDRFVYYMWFFMCISLFTYIYIYCLRVYIYIFYLCRPCSRMASSLKR